LDLKAQEDLKELLELLVQPVVPVHKALEDSKDLTELKVQADLRDLKV
jgi:hypothetical protein